MKDKEKTREQLIRESAILQERIKVLESSVILSKNAEEALRYSEKKFADIFDNIVDGILLAEESSKKFYTANRAFCKMLGYSLEEIKGMEVGDIHPKESLPFVMGQFERQTHKEITMASDIPLKRKDGTIFYADINSTLLIMGQKRYLMGVFRDITERKKIESKLEESRQRHRLITENTSDLISVTTLTGVCIYVSPSHKQVLGYEPEELLGKSGFDFIHPGDKPRLLLLLKKYTTEYIKKIFKAKESYPVEFFEYRISDKKGNYHNLEVTANLAKDISGRSFNIIYVSRDVTARKNAEAKLEEERSKAGLYLNIVGTIIVVLDRRGEITLINKCGSEMLGYSKEEIVGKNWFDNFLPKEVVSDVKKVFSRLIKGETEPVEYYENSIIDKDGRIHIILWHNTVVKDGAGSIIGTLGSGEDITKRKIIENELYASEEKFRQLVSTTTDAIMLFDADTREFIEVNKSAEELYGYSKKEFLQLRHQDITAEQAKSEESIKETIGKRLKEIPIRYHRKKDGTIFPVEISVSSFILGRRKALCGVVRDITARKKAEEEIRSSHERLKILFESAPDAYYLNDLKGVFIDSNKAAEELIGFKKEELIGKSFLNIKILSPDQILKAAALLARNVLGHPTGPDEFTIRQKSGDIVIIEIRTYPVKIEGQTLVLGIARDITIRKEAEEALKKQLNNLEKFHKIAVGRELRMKELKQIIKDLEEKLGRSN